MAITLEIIEGVLKGKTFTFEGHDTFLFGRATEAHCSLPDDPYVSRHHFLLEVNAPEIIIRDLGSMNGIVVNGTQHGGRLYAPDGQAPAVILRLGDGDRIKVGATVFEVHVETEFKRRTLKLAPRPGAIPSPPPAAAPSPPPDLPGPKRMVAAKKRVICAHCRQDASAEVGRIRAGEYVCRDCREQLESSRDALEKLMISGVMKKEPGAPDLPDYEIGKLLGKGGMGAVYLGRNRETGRQVAIKVMLPKVAADEDAAKTFQREIKITQHLKHPNIIAFLDHGYVNGVFYLVLEYACRGNVEEMMDRFEGKLPLGESIPVMRGTLQGLAHAHARGYVHRDLKPQNLLLDEVDGILTPKISDFGLAKNFQMAGLSGMTMTGTVGGTLIFMPPEQVTHYKYVFPASDVFSIGATFYYMLTGSVCYDLFPGADPMSVILEGKVVPIRARNKELPKPLAQVIDQAIQPNKGNRWIDAQLMLEALEEALRKC